MSNLEAYSTKESIDIPPIKEVCLFKAHSSIKEIYVFSMSIPIYEHMYDIFAILLQDLFNDA